ncbi:nucleoside-diphosphate-sugar epimerase [Pyrenophora seminiperda CCB06]|uniref:Nucleoside-diphosphate-sugar epimerase n=1 Tax=Pyrenophora seminiperda CCB06 TaxID=1302712 RepID=A0A3M7MGK9_9PLEO|nr:nucleoside-diphosphate-sugar epimerase [Pyrenophora seminiperda CCB06]
MGYIGGSVLHAIATTHPDYEITVLLRTTPPLFATRYPNIKIVPGDFNSTALLTTQASQADLVIHTGNSDHEPSLQALVDGLLLKSTPGYLIHLSGTGLVSDWHTPTHLGLANPKIWSDVSCLPEIKSLPMSALHRNTEALLHAWIEKHAGKINIAIVCPPDVYGQGKGLGRTTSALVPVYVHEVRALGAAFYVASGTNRRSWVHVDDLTRLYLLLVEAALAGGLEATHFGKNGYYFAATQEHSQLDLARETGRILHQHGVINDAQPVRVGLEQLDTMVNCPEFPGLRRYMFASNSRTRAERAERLFAYKAQAPGLMDVLESDVLDIIKEE